jgi:hippurate hydrolase
MRHASVGRVLIAAALAIAGPANTADFGSAKQAIARSLDANYADLFRLYADIHANPELGFHETRTAALLAAQMRQLGFDVTEHVGGTGVVAIFRNGPGPTVLVRTEMDALPMEEKTGLPYASHVQADYNGRLSFVAHSCGHDIHMASWIGTARALKELKNQWHGTLMFIAQPAEEALGGASAMLKDGLFTRFPKPDYGFALHTGPYAYGHVLYRPGVLTSNSDDIVITFKGRGGHGSSPDKTIDPVLIAARFVVDVQSVISREKDPQQAGVVSIGLIQGGTAGNIIPDEVTVRGTIRNYDPEVRAKLKAGVLRVAQAEALMAGAPAPDIHIGEHGANAVLNDPELAERTGVIFRAAFGTSAERRPNPIQPSEDYAEFVNAGMTHSLFFEIGIYDPKQVAAADASGPPLPFNHSPQYAPVPEPTIRTGVMAMSLAVLNVLSN